MGEDEAPPEKHLGQISQIQRLSHLPQHHQRDEISVILEAIVHCSCPFIATALTRATAETPGV
jgi:hypothetical protein